MYILVRVIALLFHCALSVWRASLSAVHTAFVSEHFTGRARAALNSNYINYRLLYLTSFYKALHIKLVTCLEQIVLCTVSTAVQSVSSLDIFFRCARIKLLYIDINGIASYCIAYKKYIDISYKLDIPPSPSLYCPNAQWGGEFEWLKTLQGPQLENK